MAGTSPEQLETLRQYAAGMLGTRQAIARAGLDDYAGLMIAMARNGLAFPKPADTPKRRANVELARAILQPRLRAGAVRGVQ
ncbi:MAG: hypothetical protein L0Y57_15225 [Beijerinckiaceae bacterium]|nr:hypothetical protein [Beijerinckiaceae bacterium]